MALDSSIYGLVGRGVRSVADYDNEANQNEANALNLLMGKRKLAAEDQAMADDQALRKLVGGFGSDPNANAQALFNAGRLKEGLGYQKANADVAKTNAEADEKLLKSANEAGRLYRQQLENVRTPDDLKTWLAAQYQDPRISKFVASSGSLESKLAQIPQTPEEFERFKMQGALGLEKFIDVTKPKIEQQNLGGTMRTVAIDPLTGKPTVTDSAAITESANNIANNQRLAQEGAANRSVQMRGQNMTDARAREAQKAADQAVTYKTDEATGETVALPTKITPGSSVTGTKVLGADGQPLKIGKGGQSGAKVTDAKDVLALLDQAEPLIDKATNSYLGTGVDEAARMIGKSTQGAQAAAELRALEGALISKMPKMSGPQSDKDVLLYRQMAGQIGDATVPAATKKAAMRTIREINERAAGITPQATNIDSLLDKYK